MRRRSFVLPSAVLTVITGTLVVVAACGDATSSSDTAAAPTATATGAPTRTTAPATTTTSPASNGDAAPSVDAAEEDAGPSDPVRFVAFGDQGKGCTTPTDGQCAVAAAVKTKCDADGCDFGLLLGDNFYPSGAASVDDPVFQSGFEQPYANIKFPFYVALGNHDYGTNGTGLDFPRGQVEVDYTAKSSKWKMPAKVYHQVFSNVEFFALDTNQVLLGNDAQQRIDVAAWIAASKAKWKIVFGHHPYLSNGVHGNAGNYDGLGFLPGVIPAAGKNVKSFVDDVVCGKVDLYLCGHDHDRQWLQDTCKGTELAVSGGGASTTELKGTNPTRFEKSAIGFLYVTIIGKTLTAQFLDEKGNVEFTRTLTK